MTILLTVVLFTLVSTCLAQNEVDNNDAKARSVRAKQSQIQYNDPEGSRVDWKLYAPQNQWRSHLESSRRLERPQVSHAPEDSDSSSKQQTRPVYHQAPIQVEAPQYQPYSSVPNRIKQLILDSYMPQGPYVDPGAFVYRTFVPVPMTSTKVGTTDDADDAKKDQSILSQTLQLEREYYDTATNFRASEQSNDHQNGDRMIGRVPERAGIKYKDEGEEEERSEVQRYQQPYGLMSQSNFGVYKQDSGYSQYNNAASQAQNEAYEKQQSAQQYRPNEKRESELRYPEYNSDDSQSTSKYGNYNDQSSVNGYSRYNNEQQSERQISAYEEKSRQPIKPVSETNYDKNMPMAIQQLLNYQAQLPYNVIANHILYRPKQLFIPKPLPENEKISRQYPSKIYFVKNDGQIYESSENPSDEDDNKKRY